MPVFLGGVALGAIGAWIVSDKAVAVAKWAAIGGAVYVGAKVAKVI